MKIVAYDLEIAREPLVTKFGFKGGYFTEKWVTYATLKTEGGLTSVAPGGLSVLWSDADIFMAHSEVGGNLLMSILAEYGAKLVAEGGFTADTPPPKILEAIVPLVHRYAIEITGNPHVRRTFVLNALVSLDFSLWKLYAQAIGATTFDAMLPANYQELLSYRAKEVAFVPLLSYGISKEEIVSMAEAGARVFKVKLGQAGDAQEMLTKDSARVSEIYTTLQSTEGGEGVCYYLDANGRYEEKETLLRLVDHLEKIGMLDDVIVLEEPSDGKHIYDVSELPFAVAADESIESVSDVKDRIEAGYKMFAIKPAGKTLSASLEMIEAAYANDIPCFIADSSCVPELCDWNRNVAARLQPLPVLGMNMMESNGADHYRNWEALIAEHPHSKEGWLQPQGGIYVLDEHFYAASGGIFS